MKKKQTMMDANMFVDNTLLSFFFLEKKEGFIYFTSKAELQRGRDRQLSSLCWFTFKLAAAAQAGLVRS